MNASILTSSFMSPPMVGQGNQLRPMPQQMSGFNPLNMSNVLSPSMSNQRRYMEQQLTPQMAYKQMNTNFTAPNTSTLPHKKLFGPEKPSGFEDTKALKFLERQNAVIEKLAYRIQQEERDTFDREKRGLEQKLMNLETEKILRKQEESIRFLVNKTNSQRNLIKINDGTPEKDTDSKSNPLESLGKLYLVSKLFEGKNKPPNSDYRDQRYNQGLQAPLSERNRRASPSFDMEEQKNSYGEVPMHDISDIQPRIPIRSVQVKPLEIKSMHSFVPPNLEVHSPSAPQSKVGSTEDLQEQVDRPLPRSHQKIPLTTNSSMEEDEAEESPDTSYVEKSNNCILDSKSDLL